MKKKLTKYFYWGILLLLGILFVAKFAGGRILRFYVESGVGDCQKIPILCMTPREVIDTPQINEEYIKELLPYSFPTFTISLPKGFNVIQSTIKKVYFKKAHRRPYAGPVIYLLHRKQDFFINLFPQVDKQGVKDDYDFIKRTMFANLKEINNLTDAFFVIMKSIFIPDLKSHTNVKMIQFSMPDRRGFINYNLTNKESYYDCNVIDSAGDFYKIYIKDKDSDLDLYKLFAIISTFNPSR
ncbi:MAG: hypothetical protein PHU96_02115 [Candidatus Omnitrophica bacterium]|nr:hypothetical protein [Candidatus Omnitrophota bacterium]